MEFDFLTGIDGPITPLPSEYQLMQNYPNPFNTATNISFEIPESGIIDISVYNLLGRKVTTLFSGLKKAGRHSVTWDAAGYSSGIYFYKLTAGDKVFTKRMTLLK
jgi:hypothetical protein